MAVKDVGMEEWDSGSGSDELRTQDLATCIRIAIVGDYPAEAQVPSGSPDRFLAHVVETTGPPVELTGLMNEVKAAVATGLTNLRATVVLCAPQSLGLNISGPLTRKRKAQIKEDIKEQDDHNDMVLGDVEKVVEADHVSEVEHNWQENWKLEITSTKQIQYGKQ